MTTRDGGEGFSHEIIVFDSKSGISEEEQREILAKIDNIAEKNRLSLSENKKTRFKAKKSGGLFPVIVNIAAFAALAGGLIVLSYAQSKTDSLVRTGAKVYNSAERALIEEIRKETLALLEEKDREISLYAGKSGGAGGGEYLSTLAVLRNERSKILEDARAREAVVQARMDIRTRETAPPLQTAPPPAADAAGAGGELARLNAERDLAAEIEAQMGGFFASLNAEIAEDRLEDASETVKAMREFINTPAFRSLRSIRERKEMYTQAVNTYETIIGEASENRALSNSDPDYMNRVSGLQARIAALENDMAEKDKTIDAVSSQGSGATRRLNELAKENGALQADNKRLQSDLDKQTRSVTSLQQSVNSLKKTEADLKTEKAETARLAQIVGSNEKTITNRNEVLAKIRGEIEGGKDINDMSFNEIRDSLAKIKAAMQGLN